MCEIILRPTEDFNCHWNTEHENCFNDKFIIIIIKKMNECKIRKEKNE